MDEGKGDGVSSSSGKDETNFSKDGTSSPVDGTNSSSSFILIMPEPKELLKEKYNTLKESLLVNYQIELNELPFKFESTKEVDDRILCYGLFINTLECESKNISPQDNDKQVEKIKHLCQLSNALFSLESYGNSENCCLKDKKAIIKFRESLKVPKNRNAAGFGAWLQKMEISLKSAEIQKLIDEKGRAGRIFGEIFAVLILNIFYLIAKAVCVAKGYSAFECILFQDPTRQKLREVEFSANEIIPHYVPPAA